MFCDDSRKLCADARRRVQLNLNVNIFAEILNSIFNVRFSKFDLQRSTLRCRFIKINFFRAAVAVRCITAKLYRFAISMKCVRVE